MNVWSPVSPCAPPTAGTVGSGANLSNEPVTVTATNTFAALHHNADGNIGILFVNGLGFSAPDVLFSGTTITWYSTVYSVTSGDTVFAFYSYSS
jgi:hypothetical protein